MFARYGLKPWIAAVGGAVDLTSDGLFGEIRKQGYQGIVLTGRQTKPASAAGDANLFETTCAAMGRRG
ncbi:hypothetical protein ACFQO7_31940 [Catellatospora aurea]|uniref:Uncharacterized protein n=1 Tax=Catellatospora aurea TaxID=1337874 RepID=A0ABW2H4C3_9ACTN